MRKTFVVSTLFATLLLAACETNDDDNNTPDKPTVENPATENKPTPNTDSAVTQPDEQLQYYLVAKVDANPPEIGTYASMLDNEELYHSWLDIYQFTPEPPIDLTTQNALFISAEGDGCGLTLDALRIEKDTLVATLKKEDASPTCTKEIKPQSMLVAVDKLDDSVQFITLKNGEELLIEKDQLYYD